MNFTTGNTGESKAGSPPRAPAATHDVNVDDLPVAEQIPYDYCCPLTYELFVDPVITADGQTYERGFIQDWIDRGNNTSPITGLALAHTGLVENIALRNVVQEWKTERASMERVPVPNLVAPASLLRLSKHFQGLDLIREQLEAALDGWKPPVVVVFGQESCGKSTLLERIAMVPLFPKGEDVCTRLPILVEMR